MTTITRHAYVNTRSEAGSPEEVVLDSKDVIYALSWTNYYGNPSYTLYLKNGDCLFCVDDYGCMNDLNHISLRFVQRKKDLF